MRFSCDSCGAQYVISDQKLGERGVKVRCKKCSFVNVVRPEGYVGEDAPATTVDFGSDLTSADVPTEGGFGLSPLAGDPDAPEIEPGVAAGLELDGPPGGMDYGATVIDPVRTGATDDMSAPDPVEALEAGGVPGLGLGPSSEPAAQPLGSLQLEQHDAQTTAEAHLGGMLGDQTSADMLIGGDLVDSQTVADSPLGGDAGLDAPSDELLAGSLLGSESASAAEDPAADALGGLGLEPGMSLGEDPDAPLQISRDISQDMEAGMVAEEIGSAFEAMFDPKGEAGALGALGGAEVGGAAPVEAPETAEPAAAASAEAPADPDEPEWYIAIDDAQHGPLTVHQLGDHWARGEANGDSLCWRHGMADWLPIDEVPALASLASMSVRPASRSELEPSSVPEPPPPSASEPKATITRESSWRPNAGSALASLAAAELEPTGMTPGLGGQQEARSAALPGASSALEKLIGGDGKASGSKFGAADQSSSTIRPLPHRADAVSSLPLREPVSAAHERRSPLVPILIAVVVLLVGVAAWALFGRSSPTPIAQAPAPAPAPAPAAAPKPAPAPAPTPAPAPAAATPTPAPAAKPKPRKKRARSTARRSTRAKKPAPAPAPPPARKKKPGRLTEDDLLPGGGGKDNIPAQLDESDILRTLRKNRGSVRECLKRQAASGSALSGVMKVKLTIQGSGRVSSVGISPAKFKGSPVGGCLRVKAKSWRFPRFRGSSVPVDFPVRVTGS